LFVVLLTARGRPEL